MAQGQAARSAARRAHLSVRPRGPPLPGLGVVRGSATESIAVLDLAAALGGGEALGDARMLFTRVAMMLAKLEARFR